MVLRAQISACNNLFQCALINQKILPEPFAGVELMTVKQ